MANTQSGGPIDESLLRLQENHISTLVWQGEERMLRPRLHSVWAMRHFQELDNRVKNAIIEAGFGHVMTIGQVDINQDLVTALVERWRTETHTFHFPQGEATITLQDVALQLGLKIDGLPLTGNIIGDVRHCCEVLLGVSPPDKYVKGKTIYLTWLRQNFQQLPDDADDIVVAQHARAHIMMLIGGCLMPDTSGARVHFMYLLLLSNLTEASQYSWGAAVLASLYRALDRAVKPLQTEIGGCLLLLQSWAWDRIKCIAPHIHALSDEEVQEGVGFPLARRWSRPMSQTNFATNSVRLIRMIFDRLQLHEFLWTPYDTPEIRPLINNIEVSMIARAKVPLICFAIVEWHAVDRVMRQFGMRQHIPDDPPNLDQLHEIDMRGRTDVYWPHQHRHWINKWNHWNAYIVHGEMDNRILHENSEYMQWYIRRTRRYISREGRVSSEYYPAHQHHEPHAQPNVPPVHVSGYMPQHHEPHGSSYQSMGFSGYMPQQGQQSSQPFGFASYTPEYSFQVPSTSNIFQGFSQGFGTTFNTPQSAYNLPPSSSCYRPTLPTQMQDMGDDDEQEDDNNNSNDDDDDDDGGEAGDHVAQQHQTIRRDRPRTRGGRVGPRTRGGRGQQPTNPVQQDERPRRNTRRTRCGTSSHF